MKSGPAQIAAYHQQQLAKEQHVTAEEKEIVERASARLPEVLAKGSGAAPSQPAPKKPRSDKGKPREKKQEPVAPAIGSGISEEQKKELLRLCEELDHRKAAYDSAWADWKTAESSRSRFINSLVAGGKERP